MRKSSSGSLATSRHPSRRRPAADPRALPAIRSPSAARDALRPVQPHPARGDRRPPGHARAGRRRHRRRGRDDRRDRPRRGRRAPPRARHHRRHARAGRLGRDPARAIDALDGARSSTSPTARSCCTWAARSSSATSHPLQHPRRPLDGLHARAWRASARRSPPTPRRPSSTRSSATPWPSSATAPPSSAWATSGRARRCRSWRARRCSSRSSPASTRSRSASTRRTPTRSSRRSSAWRRASAASTSRTSRAPRCFEIEERLKAELDIPVFHDDQHGTAVVVLAALLNALQAHGPVAARTCACWWSGSARPASRSRRSSWRRASRGSSAATRAARVSTRARRLPGRLDAGRQALVRRAHEPGAACRARPADVIDGMDLFVGLSGARRHPARGAGADGARRDGLRDGQPDAGDHARGGGARTCASWPRAARTTRTRSTTCSASRASSAARSTSARRASPSR